MYLKTERLAIRPFREADLTAFTAYRNNESWMRHQGFKGLDREAYKKALLAPPVLADGVQLAVTRKADGVLLGDIYLKLDHSMLWLGYTIAPEYARNGYAREAARAVLAWAAENGFHPVRAGVEPDNTASAGLLQSLRFRLLGRNEDGEDVYEAPPFEGA